MRPRSRVPRGVLVAAGIAGYLSFGYPPWEAAAMTLLTLTTVGFASSSHLSTGVLVFTAGLAFLGVGLFFVILGLAATAIVARLGPVQLGGYQVAYRLWYMLALCLDALAVPGQVPD